MASGHSGVRSSESGTASRAELPRRTGGCVKSAADSMNAQSSRDSAAHFPVVQGVLGVLGDGLLGYEPARAGLGGLTGAVPVGVRMRQGIPNSMVSHQLHDMCGASR